MSARGARDESGSSPSTAGGASSSPALAPHGKTASVALPCRLGRFDLAVRLASGGFGEVFLARARGNVDAFSRYFAVKTIHRHLTADPSFVAMFLDEVRVASGLHHPNLCAVVDAGESEGTYFLAMEYVVGEPLSQVMRKLARPDVPLPRAERIRMSVEIVRQIASGLHAAHQSVSADGQPLEIVHRDVAPPNLFVGYDGRISVLDFGIAQFEGRSTRTNTGTVKGHLAYIAPEQFRGQIDRRVDVWALGVVLHELLSECRLFSRATDPETMHAVLIDAIRPLPDDVPEPLRELVTAMLARDRDHRLADAAEVALRLTAFLGSRPVDLAAHLETLLPHGRERHTRLFAEADRLLKSSPSRAQPEPSEAPKERGTEDTRSRVLAKKPSRRASIFGAALVVIAALSALALAFVVGRGGAPTAAAPLAREGPPAVADTAPVAAPVAASDTAAVAVAAPETVRGVDDGETVAVAEAEVEADTHSEPEAVGEPETAPEPQHVGASRRVAAPSGEPGTLSLSTPGGWANVYERSRLLGETPGRFPLSAGRHTLRVVPGDGGRARALTVVIPSGGSLQRTVDLR